MKTFSFRAGFFILTFLAIGFAISGCSCGDDDDNDNDGAPQVDDDDLDDDTADDDAGDDDTGDDETGDDDTGDDDTHDYAVGLDGSTSYLVTDDNFDDVGDHFTVEGWASFHNMSLTQDRYLVSVGASEGGFNLYYSDSLDKLVFSYCWASGNCYWTGTNASPPMVDYFHFAATYKTYVAAVPGYEICIFLNGVQQTCFGQNDPMLPYSQPLYLGRDSFAGQHFLSGYLNEIRISSVVRYNADFTVPTEKFTPDADTVALYHFDEGSGAVAHDASGNGNDLTMHNCDWVSP